MRSMALILSGLALIPRWKIKRPRSLPEETLKTHLSGFSLKLARTQVVKGHMNILNEGVLVPGLGHNVVVIGFDVAAQLRSEACLHIMLEGGAGILEAERHLGAVVATLGSDECRLLLVLESHHDLMVPEERI